MEKKKRRQKSCLEIALARARQARRQKKSPILIGWAFIAALLSIRRPVILQATQCHSVADDDWPISDYERGYLRSPKPSHERYNQQLSMKRLMRDLRRPAARDDATQFLLARIDDVGLRGWVIEQISQDQINRLAIHVRPNLPDTAVIASWQAVFDAENTTDDEAINEALQTQHAPKY